MDWTKPFAARGTTKLFLDEAEKFWIEVRDELNHAEQRLIAVGSFRRVYREAEKEEVLEFDRKAGGDLKVLAYLVDWNLLGPDGKTIDISTEQAKQDAVRNLKFESYKALEAAIDAHVLERQSKNAQRSGEKPSAPTSA
jgi:hypothetical protein